jgi:hypothetical protein
MFCGWQALNYRWRSCAIDGGALEGIAVLVGGIVLSMGALPLALSLYTNASLAGGLAVSVRDMVV